jgi:hypothetical protein
MAARFFLVNTNLGRRLIVDFFFNKLLWIIIFQQNI